MLPLAGGKQFRIVAWGASAQNSCIQRVRLNGRLHHRLYITHADVVAGGELEFGMGPQPNKNFGTGPLASPAAELPAASSPAP